MPMKIYGKTASPEAVAFIETFLPLAFPNADHLRQEEWPQADTNGQGTLTLAYFRFWIYRKLESNDRFQKWAPIYSLVFASVAEPDFEQNTTNDNNNNEMVVTAQKFRLLAAHLCLYALALDAFTSIITVGPTEGIQGGEETDWSMTRQQWLEGSTKVARHGFQALKGLRRSENKGKVFDKIDSSSNDTISLEQWCNYMRETEIAAGSFLGALVSAEKRAAPDSHEDDAIAALGDKESGRFNMYPDESESMETDTEEKTAEGTRDAGENEKLPHASSTEQLISESAPQTVSNEEPNTEAEPVNQADHFKNSDSKSNAPEDEPEPLLDEPFPPKENDNASAELSDENKSNSKEPIENEPQQESKSMLEIASNSAPRDVASLQEESDTVSNPTIAGQNANRDESTEPSTYEEQLVVDTVSDSKTTVLAQEATAPDDGSFLSGRNEVSSDMDEPDEQRGARKGSAVNQIPKSPTAGRISPLEEETATETLVERTDETEPNGTSFDELWDSGTVSEQQNSSFERPVAENADNKPSDIAQGTVGKGAALPYSDISSGEPAQSIDIKEATEHSTGNPTDPMKDRVRVDILGEDDNEAVNQSTSQEVDMCFVGDIDELTLASSEKVHDGIFIGDILANKTDASDSDPNAQPTSRINLPEDNDSQLRDGEIDGCAQIDTKETNTAPSIALGIPSADLSPAENALTSDTGIEPPGSVVSKEELASLSSKELSDQFSNPAANTALEENDEQTTPERNERTNRKALAVKELTPDDIVMQVAMAASEAKEPPLRPDDEQYSSDGDGSEPEEHDIWLSVSQSLLNESPREDHAEEMITHPEGREPLDESLAAEEGETLDVLDGTTGVETPYPVEIVRQERGEHVSSDDPPASLQSEETSGVDYIAGKCIFNFSGPSASMHVGSFLRAFLPLAYATPESSKACEAEWTKADQMGNGVLSVVEVEKWVERRLVTILGAERGKQLYEKFFPAYSRAFHASRDIPEALSPEDVSQSEFRLLVAHLCVFALAFDAFSVIDISSASDQCISRREWLARCRRVSDHGFYALKKAAGEEASDDSLGDMFDAMDVVGRGTIQLSEWCRFLVKVESAFETDIAQFLSSRGWSGEKKVSSPARSPSRQRGAGSWHSYIRRLGEASATRRRLLNASVSPGDNKTGGRDPSTSPDLLTREAHSQQDEAGSPPAETVVPSQTTVAVKKLPDPPEDRSGWKEAETSDENSWTGTRLSQTIAGDSASANVRTFLDIFLPLIVESQENYELPVEPLNLTNSTAWIHQIIMARLVDETMTMELYQIFAPVYGIAHVASQKTLTAGTSTNAKVRCFVSYLCVYALALDAFDTLVMGTEQRGSLPELSWTEWLVGCQSGKVSNHGFLVLATQQPQELPDIFENSSSVSLEEWCRYLSSTEIEARTTMGKLLAGGADSSVKMSPNGQILVDAFRPNESRLSPRSADPPADQPGCCCPV